MGASRHWWRTVLRKNRFPAAALAYLQDALAVGLIMGSVVTVDGQLALFWIVLGVLPAVIALVGWWARNSSARL